MPTAKPRITITLTEHQHFVLSKLSGLQRASMSSIVVDLLDTTLPVFERLVGVLDNAASAPQNVLDELRRSAQTAEAQVVEMGSSISGLLEELVKRASREDSTAPEGRREASREAKPPTSNRGVRITSPQPKFASNSPMKKGEKHGRVEK